MTTNDGQQDRHDNRWALGFGGFFVGLFLISFATIIATEPGFQAPSLAYSAGVFVGSVGPVLVLAAIGYAIYRALKR